MLISHLWDLLQKLKSSEPTDRKTCGIFVSVGTFRAFQKTCSPMSASAVLEVIMIEMNERAAEEGPKKPQRARKNERQNKTK